MSHSSTEAKVISLDAVLRMDGIRALDLWDLVIEISNKTKGQESLGNLSRTTTVHMKNRNPTKHINLDLNNLERKTNSRHAFKC